MLCDKCKIREARLYYTEIINGDKKEQHLCEECANQYITFQMEAPVFAKTFTLGNLLATLFDVYGDTKELKKNDQGLACDQCGLTYQQFLNRGTFGCAHCYESFRNTLEGSLKSIQGSNIHNGKKPNNQGMVEKKPVQELTEIQKLSIQLQDAIEKEEYEKAAKIRDQIRLLKKEEMNNA